MKGSIIRSSISIERLNFISKFNLDITYKHSFSLNMYYNERKYSISYLHKFNTFNSLPECSVPPQSGNPNNSWYTNFTIYPFLQMILKNDYKHALEKHSNENKTETKDIIKPTVQTSIGQRAQRQNSAPENNSNHSFINVGSNLANAKYITLEVCIIPCRIVRKNM